MRRGLLIGAVTIALSVVPLAYALLTQHGVKTTRLYEHYPAADSDGGINYFAWSQNSKAHPSHSDAYLKRGSQPRVNLGRLAALRAAVDVEQQSASHPPQLAFRDGDDPRPVV